jgi:hypothetical protein
MNDALTKFAWLAGVMDGEGCFFVRHNHNGGGICGQISFCSKDEAFMNAVLNVLALVDLKPNVTHYSTSTTRMHGIHIGNKEAILRLTSALLPYLQLKRPQAGILNCLMARKSRTRKPTRLDFRLVQLVRDLNQRRATLNHTASPAEGAETITPAERH